MVDKFLIRRVENFFHPLKLVNYDFSLYNSFAINLRFYEKCEMRKK